MKGADSLVKKQITQNMVMLWKRFYTMDLQYNLKYGKIHVKYRQFYMSHQDGASLHFKA